MNFENNENLKNSEDIKKAEQLFAQYPAPRPDDATIADIKSKVCAALERKNASGFRYRVYGVVAAAAVLVIVASVSVRFFGDKAVTDEEAVAASMIPAIVWQSDDIIADDAELARLNTEIEEIENEMLAVSFSENGENGNVDLTEIDSEFWKG